MQATRRKRENLDAGFRDAHGVLELRRQRPVARDRRPAVGQHLHRRAAQIDHRLDGEEHAGLERRALAPPTIVQDVRLIVEELAQAMGAALACSRPIVDAKWLDKSRQVGTSGQTVKPKVYLALGISGAFQHVGGIKGSPFLVAVNKNPKAPIFQTASVGIVADLLELVPELTAQIRQAK